MVRKTSIFAQAKASSPSPSKTQAHVHIILYWPKYRSLNLLSSVSHHLGQLSEGDQLASMSTVHIYSAVDLVCWEFGAEQDELVDISLQLQNKKEKG